MDVHQLDPIQDPRWLDLLHRDERASVFHTPGWLAALRRSYGYEPVVLTTSSPRRELANGLVFCRVKSWLTGKRMVSLPFSDHCEPLTGSYVETSVLARALRQEMGRNDWKYIELRPLGSLNGPELGFHHSEDYFFHKIDLRPSTDQLFENFHKDSVRRKVQRAKREGITYERGANRILLEKFYRVFVMTRKRHGLPPPPFQWLTNVLDCLKGHVEIRVALLNERPIAGMLSLTHKHTMTYKYGGSDMRYSNLGGMALLFWMAMLEAKAEGLTELDLGRCDPDNPGLIKYKDRLGSLRSTVKYWRMSTNALQTSQSRWPLQMAKRLFPFAPAILRIKMGNVLYPHVG